MSDRPDKRDPKHRYHGPIDRLLNRWVFRPRFWIGLATVFVLLALISSLMTKRFTP